MSTIFISHSSQDNDIAREIGRRLDKQKHHSVFLDIDPEKGIVGGQSWERTLYRKLRACRVVIALCTDHYLNSHWCFAEIALARMEGKHIVALQADPLDEQAKMPAILTERQFIDLRRDGDEGYLRLWEALKALDIVEGTGTWNPKKSPYLGLSAYQKEHAPVFFGREDESRAGIELLDRGAPGLIMVLGASGSGKSSLVRAGMLPRLRSRKDEWLIVDPFRPGRDPLAELTESLAQSFRRYAPEHAGEAGSRERIRERLHAVRPDKLFRAPPGADEPDGPDQKPDVAEDERLRRLMDLLERLHEDPPTLLAGRLRDYLEWSLDDLRRICGERAAVVSSQEIISDYTTPLIEIAHDLRRVSQRRGARVLLVVDQLEELLGHKKTDEKAGHFLELLRASIEADQSPMMVLGTMRSDFLGLFQRNAAMQGIDFESLSLGPMQIEGMRRVIEEPAKLAATELENGLADRLLEDTETPDALPLLSFTLWLLWKDYRRDGKLEKDAYEQLGGLHGAVAREADALLASAKREGKESALRQAFVHMVRLTDEGTYAREARNWNAEELRPVRPMLERFVNRHLLVTRGEEGGTRTVEVAHEALFRTWKPLKAWLDSARSELLLKQQLRRDAQAWKENNRAAAFLWRGGRLEQAEELLRKGELNGFDASGSLEKEFVHVGMRQRKRHRWMWFGLAGAIFVGLAGFLVYALVTKKEINNQKIRAEQQSKVARGRLAHYFAKESANSLVESPPLSLLLAVEAVNASPVAAAEEALRHAIMKTGGLPLHGHEDKVASVAFSPDGNTLVTRSRDNTVFLWNLRRTEAKPTVLREIKGIKAFAFSPSGNTLATGDDDKTVRLWDLKRPEVIQTALRGKNSIAAMAFSPQGTMLAAVDHIDNNVWLWELKSPQAEPRMLTSFFPGAKMIAFSPDGNRLIIEFLHSNLNLLNFMQGEPEPFRLPNNFRAYRIIPDPSGLITATFKGSVELRDLKKPEEAKPLINLTEQLSPNSKWAFSPDGGALATASRQDGVSIWSLKQQEPEKQILSGISGIKNEVKVLEFSPDGEQLIAAIGNALMLWDPKQPEANARELHGHEGNVTALAFSPDGHTLVTGGGDGIVRIWNLGRRTAEPRKLPGGIWAYAYGLGLDGGTLMRRMLDQTEANNNWQEALKQAIKEVSTYNLDLNLVAFSLDGEMVAVMGKDNKVQLWDLKKPSAEAKDLTFVQAANISALAFGPDNDTLATGNEEGRVQLWNLKHQKDAPKELLTGHEKKIWGLRFSPNGSILLVASNDTVQVWDLKQPKPTPQVLPELAMTDVLSLVFSPNGEMLAVSEDSAVLVWDLKQLEASPIVLQTKEPVRFLAFSSDGNTLATSAEGMVKLWDLKQPEAIPRTLPKHSSDSLGVVFSPDGGVLATIGLKEVFLWDLEGLLWRVPNDELIERACERVRRNLTLDEWQQLLGDETYSKFCNSQPLDPDFIAKGRKMAREGKIEEALKYFEATLVIDAGSDPDMVDVKLEARQLVAPVFVDMGSELARKGEIKLAITKFNNALELNPSLKFNAEVEARRLATQPLIMQGIKLAEKGEIENAMEAFVKAQKYDPAFSIPAKWWNPICWNGSLWGYAAEVMSACENAVKLDPENGIYRDSRGVARALTGDYSGAIDDFGYYLKWVNNIHYLRDDRKIEERKNWIKALNDRQNPFDAATLEALK